MRMIKAAPHLLRCLEPDGAQHVVLPVVAVHLDGVVGGVVAVGAAVGDQVDHQEAASGRHLQERACGVRAR